MRLALLSFTFIACAPTDEPYILRSIAPDSSCTTELEVGMPITAPDGYQASVLELGGQRFDCVSFDGHASIRWACVPTEDAASSAWALELPYDSDTLDLVGTRYRNDGSEACTLHLTASRPLGFEDAIEPIAIVGSILLLGPPAGIYHTLELLPAAAYAG